MLMMRIGRGKISNRILLPLIGAIALILLSCGSDAGVGGESNSVAGGGIGGTGISVGSVSSFGSIISNGIHFDTSRAEVIVEGQLLGKGDLAANTLLGVGQKVRIEGDIHDDGTGVAARVYYDKTIEGPVTSVEVLDPYTSCIVVLGQRVIIDSQTKFVGTTLESLIPDTDTDDKSHDLFVPSHQRFGKPLPPKHRQTLEISGFFGNDGVLKAGYVAKKRDVKTFTVTGSVTELDTDAQRFKIGELAIDYSLVKTPMPIFENGEKIRVKGHLSGGQVFEAHDVLAWAPLDFRLDAERIKIQGVVFQPKTASDQDIMVDGVAVHMDEDTSFQGIDSVEELDSGIEVLVNGILTEGVVQAGRVEVKSDSIRVRGQVSNLDREDATFTIDDQIIRINPTTTIYKYFSSPCQQDEVRVVEDVEEGDDVVVYGWIRTDDSITAKYIKINPKTSNCERQCYWVYSRYYGRYVLYCPNDSSSNSQSTTSGGAPCN